MRKAAVLDALRRFLIQVRGFFGVIGVDGDDHAALRHQGRVVRNRVVSFDFVGPPIGKRGCSDTGCGDFVGDFVAFENLNEWIEPQIAAWRDQILLSRSNLLVVAVPRVLVIARFGERSANCFFNSHSGGGIATLAPGNGKIGTLGIFTQGELDARERAFERKLRSGLSPAQLNHDGLAADGIGAAVKNVRGGNAAGEVAIDRNVIGIENFRYIRDGRNGDAAFVDAAIHGDVRVAINDAGRDEHSGAVNDLRAAGSFDVWAHFGNLAVLDQHRTVLDGALRHGQDSSVLNQDDGRRVRRGSGGAEAN